MTDTSQARAALMRLRDRLVEGRNQVAILANTADPKTPLDGAVSTIDMVVLREIDKEIAALPADEAAGACDLVAEERAKLVRRVGSDCCNGTDPACGGGCLFERAVRNLDMGAALARKPQPADRAVEALRVKSMNYDNRCPRCGGQVDIEKGATAEEACMVCDARSRDHKAREALRGLVDVVTEAESFVWGDGSHAFLGDGQSTQRWVGEFHRQRDAVREALRAAKEVLK